MKLRSSLTALFFVIAAGLLSACDSSEERAEKHFQSAISLLAAGDQERAIVEFRNVFKLNGRHREARSQFAALQRERGNIQGAVGQYLRLVEQYPDDFEGHKAIAEMYADSGNWAEMERNLTAAAKLGPDDTSIRALQVMSGYQAALESDDTEGLVDVVAKAQELAVELPENLHLNQILIDNHLRRSEFNLALVQLDKTILLAPNDRRLYLVRLSVLSSLGDSFGIEAQLKDMIKKFPDDNSSLETLVRWYVSQGQMDEAETYLRSAANSDTASVENQIALVQFLLQLHGEEAAIEELNKLVATEHSDPMILSLRSGIEFDRGNHDLAISQMQDLLEGLEQSDESRRLNVALSQMLEVTGNVVGARALIEQVLLEDSSNVPALKIQANHLIDSDQASDAILALRTALDQNPQDAETLTLLARAYERNGNQDLVSEMLALAMGASDNAPVETIRYAQQLFGQAKFRIAESVLIESLRLSPGNLDILIALGGVYVRTEDWPRAEQVQATLRRLETVLALTASNELQSRIFQGQQKLSENIAFLEGLVDQGAAGFGANLTIVRNHLDAGEPQKAKDVVAKLLNAEPNNPAVRHLSASVNAALGETELAEKEYRALIEEDRSSVQVWVALFRLLSGTSQQVAAATLIDQAIVAVPSEPTLQWIKAGLLESDGDLEGAITIYDDMYAVDSGNLIIANNLASLLSTVRSDPESLQRATNIARRLRSTNVAPFQDTFGWIEFLRGETSEAVKALEPAAANLRQDPSVQYHLAKAYIATKNLQGALGQFENVVALTGAADTRDFVVEARQEIIRLKQELAATAQE